MSKAKVALVASNDKRIWIDIEDDQEVLIGRRPQGGSETSERPDCDLGTILSPDMLVDVAVQHATLVFKHGCFWLKSLVNHNTLVGPYVLQYDHPFRLADKDVVCFGGAKVTFMVPGNGSGIQL